MARALYYPPASQTAQWFNDNYSGSPITPNVLVWHTTETGGWPGYGGGASAPTLTYNPESRQWRQHFRLDRSARALRNLAGGVETNTLNACQVEIVAYSDETLARSRGHLPVSKLSKANLADLGDFARFIFDEWGLRLDIDPGWVRSNYRNPRRMSGSQWRGFHGHTGHNRVPENTHWDPAALDIDTIIAHARGGAELEDDMTPQEMLQHRVKLGPGLQRWFGTGIETITVQSLLTYAGAGAWEARDERAKLEAKVDALLDAQGGLDTPTVLQRIDQRHAEAAQQRQVLADTMTAKLDAIVDATQGSDPAEAKLAAILEILGVDA